MSDNDSVSRKEVLNHLGDLFTLCSETGSITERDLEIFEKIIKSLSPVHQEMSAREFFATIRRMCPKIGCDNCPGDVGEYCIFDFIQDSDIEFVERRWLR